MTNKAAIRWKTVLTYVTFAALGLMIYALRRQIADVIDNLGKVNTWALLLMVPLEMLNYHAYTRLYQRLLRILHEKIGYKSMYGVTLELNFVNTVFPSGGVSGISYFGLRMKHHGIGGGKSTLLQILKFALIFISFQILLFIGLFCLAVVGRTSNLTILVSGTLATLLFVITVGGSFIISSRTRIRAFFGWFTRGVNRIIHVVRPKHPETINIKRAEALFDDLHDNYMLIKKNYTELGVPLLYALLANITEILTIYTVYIAFGHAVNIGAVIIAYAVANFAGLISVLPGGVGIYEALMTAVMATAGVRPALSLPVTVMYRVLNMLIQLPPGYYLYHRSLHGRDDAK
jgi:uncharacterized protein (TIRG00374 family)